MTRRSAWIGSRAFLGLCFVGLGWSHGDFALAASTEVVRIGIPRTAPSADETVSESTATFGTSWQVEASLSNWSPKDFHLPAGEGTFFENAGSPNFRAELVVPMWKGSFGSAGLSFGAGFARFQRKGQVATQGGTVLPATAPLYVFPWLVGVEIAPAAFAGSVGRIRLGLAAGAVTMVANRSALSGANGAISEAGPLAEFSMGGDLYLSHLAPSLDVSLVCEFLLSRGVILDESLKATGLSAGLRFRI